MLVPETKTVGNIVITKGMFDCGTPWTIAVSRILDLVAEGKKVGRLGSYTWVVVD